MKLGRFSQVLIIIFIISLFGFGNFGEVGAQLLPGQERQDSTIQNVAPSTESESNIVEGSAELLGWDDDLLKKVRSYISINNFVVTSFMGISGAAFDFVLNFAIGEIGGQGGTYEQYFSEGVEVLWKIFRDIGNILIIFSLLYLAIRTIIEGNGFADRKTLTRILIAAVFINFSLFFTKIIFDVSNRVAVEIYQSIGGDLTASGQGQGLAADIANSFNLKEQLTSPSWGDNVPIIGQIKGAWGWAGDIISGNGNKLDDIAVELLAAAMVALMAITIGVIFLIGSIMLVYRTLVFILLMATSALGLAGSLIPYLRPYLGFWWRNVWKHAVALPAFVLMFYVSFLFIKGTFINEMQGALVGVTSGNSQAFEHSIRMIVFFLMSAFLLVLTVALPMKIGDRASSAAIRSSKAVGRFGANVLARGTAFAGRNSVGAAGRYVGNLAKNNESLSRITGATLKKDFSNWGEVVAGASLQKVIRAGNEIGNKKTYDPRNIKVGGKTLGQRFGLGKGVENYETIIKLKQKELEEKGKKDAELFGWDKKTDKEKETISNMKSDKNVLEQELKDLIKELKDIKAGKTVRDSAGNVKTLDSVRAERISKQKEIDKLSIDIGELEEKGMSMFLNRQKTFMSVLSKAVKLDIESIKAVAKIDKARKKKWTAGNEKRFEQMLNKALKS